MIGVLVVHEGEGSADRDVFAGGRPLREQAGGECGSGRVRVPREHRVHRDLVEDGPVFLALWDAPMELLLTRLGVPFTRETRPFYGRPSWEHEG